MVWKIYCTIKLFISIFKPVQTKSNSKTHAIQFRAYGRFFSSHAFRVYAQWQITTQWNKNRQVTHIFWFSGVWTDVVYLATCLILIRINCVHCVKCFFPVVLETDDISWMGNYVCCIFDIRFHVQLQLLVQLLLVVAIKHTYHTFLGFMPAQLAQTRWGCCNGLLRLCKNWLKLRTPLRIVASSLYRLCLRECPRHFANTLIFKQFGF